MHFQMQKRKFWQYRNKAGKEIKKLEDILKKAHRN